ncbi:tRNA1(Val) (adenine(37)-N6)-methyltransferase [Spirosoma fluviale]|uniref:tRNA1(Val) (adenine(37)-N6)-methyltransferase n=1 Tax=Spirosoma fluviale TaxID=1597977 RepID=A0A286FIN6_9BACT|nr:methyltransferase [Spirosoma fluviale]SOD82839.1 tRNA1Val (adenine37-N6)-methyltransferase [Spirosoma fluviale]
MFSFKQFTIQQNRTAMKVCTDACVLGAYANQDAGERVEPTTEVSRILDIGTGTGLLALMAAQRNPRAVVDAVEVDDAAFSQAIENVAASPFADRIRVTQGRIQDYQPAIRYDRILTNPPFYTNHLRSPDAAVNRALHTDYLPFPELVEAVTRLMQLTGQWWVLLPPYETDLLDELAQKAGLHAFKRLFLRHNAQKPAFRVVSGYSYTERSPEQETLTIYERTNVSDQTKTQSKEIYTSDFRSLLRDFYLIF